MVPLYCKSNNPGWAGHSLLNCTEIWLLELLRTSPLDNTELLASIEATGPPTSSRTASIPSSKLAFSTYSTRAESVQNIGCDIPDLGLHDCICVNIYQNQLNWKCVLGALQWVQNMKLCVEVPLIGFGACASEISIVTSVVWSVQLYQSWNWYTLICFYHCESSTGNCYTVFLLHYRY